MKVFDLRSFRSAFVWLVFIAFYAFVYLMAYALRDSFRWVYDRLNISVIISCDHFNGKCFSITNPTNFQNWVLVNPWSIDYAFAATLMSCLCYAKTVLGCASLATLFLHSYYNSLLFWNEFRFKFMWISKEFLEDFEFWLQS